jgi:hypothetical protein
LLLGTRQRDARQERIKQHRHIIHRRPRVTRNVGRSGHIGAGAGNCVALGVHVIPTQADKIEGL